MGVCGLLPKILTLFMTEICDFMTKHLIPYDCCSWHSCPNHNLLRPFVDGLISDDEKVASYRKTYPIQD